MIGKFIIFIISLLAYLLIFYIVKEEFLLIIASILAVLLIIGMTFTWMFFRRIFYTTVAEFLAFGVAIISYTKLLNWW